MANNKVKFYEGEANCCDINVMFPNHMKNLCTITFPPLHRRRGQAGGNLTVEQEKIRLLRDAGIGYPPADELEMVLRQAQGEEVVMDDNSEISNYREKMCCGGGCEIEIRMRTGQERGPNPSHPQDFGYNLKP